MGGMGGMGADFTNPFDLFESFFGGGMGGMGGMGSRTRSRATTGEDDRCACKPTWMCLSMCANMCRHARLLVLACLLVFDCVSV